MTKVASGPGRRCSVLSTEDTHRWGMQPVTDKVPSAGSLAGWGAAMNAQDAGDGFGASGPGGSASDTGFAGPLAVAVFDEHSLARDGLAAVCASHPGVDRVVVCDSLEALAAIDPPAELVLVCLSLQGRKITGQDAEAIIGRGSAVLVVGEPGSRSVVGGLLRAGAWGFISTRDSSDLLYRAIDSVLAGEPWPRPGIQGEATRLRPDLSEQERRALVLYASGMKLASVASRLGVKPTTVKEYIERVRAKYAALGRPAPTKVHLFAAAQEDGLLDE